MTSTQVNAVQPVPPVGNPTLEIKQVDVSSIPDISIINEIDFTKYIYTGYKIVIDTPLVKNNLQALFTINLDGFIPMWSITNGWENVQKNLALVQPLPQTVGFVKVYQEQIMLPVQQLYYSNRFTSGKVNIGLRITSNTSQSGNFFIAQGTSMVRKYYNPATPYRGIEFLNASGEVTDYAPNNFALVDASLNRQFSVKTTRRNPTKVQDMYKKIMETPTVAYTSIPTITRSNVIASQFAEDHLLVGILTSLPNQNIDQISISVFADYSEVSFSAPGLPVVPAQPTVVGHRQLDYNATFVGVANPSKASAFFNW
jgi:hypothetical protein